MVPDGDIWNPGGKRSCLLRGDSESLARWSHLSKLRQEHGGGLWSHTIKSSGGSPCWSGADAHNIWRKAEGTHFTHSLEERRLRGDFIAAYSYLMKGYQRRQNLTLLNGARLYDERQWILFGLGKFRLAIRNFNFFIHKHRQILEQVPRNVVGPPSLTGV